MLSSAWFLDFNLDISIRTNMSSFGIDLFRKISSDKESMVVIIEKATMTTADIDEGN